MTQRKCKCKGRLACGKNICSCKFDYLFSGYARKDIKPVSSLDPLKNIVEQFIGVLVTKFVYFPKRYSNAISKAGKMFSRSDGNNISGTFSHESRRSATYNSNPRNLKFRCFYQHSSFLVASDCGFNDGINEWKIKMHSDPRDYNVDIIGVTNNTDLCKYHDVYGDDADDPKQNFVTGKDENYQIHGFSVSTKTSVFHNGCTITVILNCNENTLSFEVDTVVGGKINLKNDKKFTWYPMILSCGDPGKYEFID